MRTKSIYICHYNFTDTSCQWLLTDDLVYAMSIDSHFQLASVQDLHDWIAATGEVFNGILAVKEGLCKWSERKHLDDYEIETEYCYIMI
jgi:hypothetical protein